MAKDRSWSTVVVRLVVGLATMAAARTLPAMDPRLPLADLDHRSWSLADGLPSLELAAVAEGPDGFIWIGSPSGTVRCDGLELAPVELPPPVEPHPASPVVHSMVAEGGALWLGGDGEVTRVTRDGVERLPLPPALAGHAVVALAAARSGGLWVVTRSQVARLTDRRFELRGPLQSSPRAPLFGVAEGPDGTLWVAADGGFAVHPPAAAPALDLPDLPTSRVVAVATDSGGSVWLGTAAGAVHLDGDRTEVFDRHRGLESALVRVVLPDRHGGVWIGTHGGGLARIVDGVVELLPDRHPLRHAIVTGLAEDREGTLWVATTGGGLHRLADRTCRLETTVDGLPSDLVQRLLVAPDGSLWATTVGTTLARRDGPRWSAFEPTATLPGSQVSGLWTLPSGEVLVGFFDAAPGALRGNRFAPAVPAVAGISALAWEVDGHILAATPRGLLRIGREGVAEPLECGAVGGCEVGVLVRGPSGGVWVGSSCGLGYVEPGGACISRDDVGAVRALTTQPDGAVWAATDTGLVLLPAPGGAGRGVVAIPLEDPPIDLALDREDVLWVSTARGLVRLLPADRHALATGRRPTRPPVRLGPADGCPADAFSTDPGMLAVLPDGRLALATFQGVAFVDPRSIAERPDPPTEISRVTADGRTLAREGPVEIELGVRRLTFEYAALTSHAPERTRYRYRLRGLDEAWVDAGTTRSTTFGRLTPGRYLFEVAATAPRGGWVEPPARFAFAVPPPFYRRPWFVGVAAVLVVAAVEGGQRLRVAALRRRQRRLETLVSARTSQLDEANRRLAELATTDELTGLANLRRFREALEEEWRRAARDRRPLTLLALDIDAFKAYNDAHGHPAGDRCLAAVAAALGGAANRPGDLAARTGGEEMALLLPATDRDHGLAVAERLRAAVEALAIDHHGSPTAPVVTVSIGVATDVPGPGRRTQDLVDDADRALYRAKRSGRNRVEAAADPAAG